MFQELILHIFFQHPHPTQGAVRSKKTVILTCLPPLNNILIALRLQICAQRLELLNPHFSPYPLKLFSTLLFPSVSHSPPIVTSLFLDFFVSPLSSFRALAHGQRSESGVAGKYVSGFSQSQAESHTWLPYFLFIVEPN